MWQDCRPAEEVSHGAGGTRAARVGAAGCDWGGEPPPLPPYHAGARALRAPPRGLAGNCGARHGAGYAWGVTRLYPEQAWRWGKAAAAATGWRPDDAQPSLC